MRPAKAKLFQAIHRRIFHGKVAIDQAATILLMYGLSGVPVRHQGAIVFKRKISEQTSVYRFALTLRAYRQSGLRPASDFLKAKLLRQFKAWPSRHTQDLVDEFIAFCLRDRHRSVLAQKRDPAKRAKIAQTSDATVINYQPAGNDELRTFQVHFYVSTSQHSLHRIRSCGFIERHFHAEFPGLALVPYQG